MDYECEICGETGHLEEDHEVVCSYDGSVRCVDDMTLIMFEEFGISKDDYLYEEILEARNNSDYEFWNELQQDIQDRISDKGLISFWHEGTWFVYQPVKEPLEISE